MKSFIAMLALVALVSGRPQVQQEPVAILRQASDISPEGSYSYSYETANGISAAEQGSPKALSADTQALSAQGSYQYTAPDGSPIAVSYIADENGYQPQGAHLPVAHPIPEAIQKALDYIAANPQPENQQ